MPNCKYATQAAITADEAAKPVREQAENVVSTFFAGADNGVKLIALKYLRLDMPHQSTDLRDLERAIVKVYR
jgi:hypothetical protein